MKEDPEKANLSSLTAILPGTFDRKQASSWSLVLTAMGIAHEVKQADGRWMIFVPEESREEASRQISFFELENFKKEADAEGNKKTESAKYMGRTVWTLFLVAAAMSLTFRYGIREKALETGAANSDRIMDGQWWRAVTALCLHADPAHFLSNLVIGGFIVVWLIEETGPGAGWFLILFTGAAGNYLNALAHGYDGHLSIGASTAVFGALGALCGIRAVKSGKSGLLKEAARTVAAGLALLAMLGSGKERVDTGAHLFGFVAGLFSGATTMFLRESGLLNIKYAGKVLGIITILAMTVSWVMAVLSS